MKSELTSSEEARHLEALQRYAVLDTLPEHAWDDLTALAAQICEAPIALISLVDGNRQRFKARVGWKMEESPREISFCTHALQAEDLFIIPDAVQDKRFAQSPLVTGEEGIRFYAGAPLVTTEGHPLGVFCVMDRVPRSLTPAQEQALRVLARQALIHLELHRHTREPVESQEELRMVTDNARVELVTAMQDITERQQAEITSRRLAAIVESSDDAIIGKDLNGIVTSWNKGAEKIFGYTADEIMGTSILRLIPEDRQDEEHRILERIRAGGSVEHFETLRKAKDGRLIDISVTVSPIKDASGCPIGVSKVARDITERKHAEEILTLLNTCVSKINDIILITEAEPIEEPGPRIVFVNDAFERLTGYTSAETVGQSPRFLQGEKTDRKILDEIRHALARKEPIRRQLVNYGKDGTEYWLDIDIVPIFNAEGRCTHFAAIERDITAERKSAESLRLFRTLIEQSSDAIEVVDAETGQFLDLNQTACRRLRYSREEMLSLHIGDVIDNGGVPFSMSALEEIKKSGFRIIEGRHRRKDGSTFPTEVNVQYIQLNRGYLLAVVRDITERKLADEERDKLMRLIERSQDFIEMSDLEGKITFMNEGARKMIGLDPYQDVSRLHFSDYVPEKWQTIFREIIIPTVREEGTWEGEMQLRNMKTGTLVDVFRATFIIHDAEGQPKFFATVTRDITAGKRAEMDLRQSETRYRTLFEYAPDGIVIASPERFYIDANMSMCRMLGYTRDELIGMHASEIVTAGELAEIKPALDDGKSKFDYPREWQLRRKDGSVFDADVIATTMPDGNLLTMVRDVTERKKLEQQFLRAQRMESIGTLAGGIAHDLNNILAPIMMSIDILKATASNAQAKIILDSIEVSARRGADIVRQVLSFARGLDGERIEVQPKHLLKDLENIIKDTFPKDIRLQFSVPDDTWTILGDPTQVHQILLNLCVNARDAMPQGGTLTIRAENCELDEQYAAMNLQARPGRYVQIMVTDSGAGIPAEVLDKIFEPFFTTKELHKGTGLGLSTVMAIVKSHDGIINVYSELGKGTTFKICLPATDIASGARKENLEEVSLPRGNGETILIVDDEASILTITSQTLQAFGYRVLTANDGAEAVAIFAQHRNEVAVVLTDMMMPVMDGPATIHALLRINPCVKIIAASGLNTNGSAAKAAGAGAEHFLMKPYTAGTLLKGLRTILESA